MNLYKNKGREIFKERKDIPNLPFSRLPIQLLNPLFKAVNSNIKLPELFGSKYHRDGKGKIFKDLLGETLLDQALVEVVITSYETDKRMPLLFTNNSDKQKSDSDNFLEICEGCRMYDAAMATSAAPTFFKSHLLKFRNKREQYTLIDGGVISNNPTTIAIVEAIKSYKIKMKGEEIPLSEILVVSLGTGRMNDSFPASRIDQWGLIQWVEPLINIVLSGQSEIIDYQIEHLLLKEQYYRFQMSYKNNSDKFNSDRKDFDNVNDAMDDADKINIDNLISATENFLKIKEVDNELNKLSEDLLAALKTRKFLK